MQDIGAADFRRVTTKVYLLDQCDLGITETCCASMAIDALANIALLQGGHLVVQLTHVQERLVAKQQHSP